MDDRTAFIYKQAERLGLEVSSNRPGDGRRRYSFTSPGGHTSSVLIGAAAAETYLEGYRHAREGSCTSTNTSDG